MRENSEGSIATAHAQALEQHNVIRQRAALEKLGAPRFRIEKGFSLLGAVQSDENQFFAEDIDDVLCKIEEACTELRFFDNNLL